MTYEEIFENNAKWMAEKNGGGDYFDNLAQGQSPSVLYIGCSDSRVTAEGFMGAEPGDVFVHRNVANVVSSLDLNVMSVIEYSVKHLGVKHVVVCGHTVCGGVKAAMGNDDLGILNPWIRNIRDVYRTHKAELDAIADEDQRYDRLVELNVEEQCLNVLKTQVVQETYKKNGSPSIHGWVFDIRTGKLNDLKLDMESKYNELKDIYDQA